MPAASDLDSHHLLWTIVPSGVDDGADIPREMVAGIYERIQQRELRSNEDHVTYVSRVEQSILGLKTVSSFPFLHPFSVSLSGTCPVPPLSHHALLLCRLSSAPASLYPLHCRSWLYPTDVWCVAVVCSKFPMPTDLISRNCPSSKEKSSSSTTCCWWATSL